MSRNQRVRVRGDDTILKIHRLFDAPLTVDEELCPWYCRPGAVVDCNVLLSIADDDAFIEAAVWQILGHETAGRQRRRWLKRLKWSSRTSVLIGMRYKTEGKRRAVRIPGLWIAVFLNPPGQQVLGPAGRFFDRLRHRIVAWRYHRVIKATTSQSSISPGERDTDRAWERAS